MLFVVFTFQKCYVILKIRCFRAAKQSTASRYHGFCCIQIHRHSGWNFHIQRKGFQRAAVVALDRPFSCDHCRKSGFSVSFHGLHLGLGSQVGDWIAKPYIGIIAKQIFLIGIHVPLRESLSVILLIVRFFKGAVIDLISVLVDIKSTKV